LNGSDNLFPQKHKLVAGFGASGRFLPKPMQTANKNQGFADSGWFNLQ